MLGTHAVLRAGASVPRAYKPLPMRRGNPAGLSGRKKANARDEGTPIPATTPWFTQVKTILGHEPDLFKHTLGGNSSHSQLSMKTFWVEQYVEMDLRYIQDVALPPILSIWECSLDTIIKKPFTKYAPGIYPNTLITDPTKACIWWDR